MSRAFLRQAVWLVAACTLPLLLWAILLVTSLLVYLPDAGAK